MAHLQETIQTGIKTLDRIDHTRLTSRKILKRYSAILILFISVFFSPVFKTLGQEQKGPLRYNPVVAKAHIKRGISHVARSTHRTTSVSLPFFDDFTGYDPLPDTGKWMDDEVYINNTMGISPPSRGVATFDALAANGIPYDSFSNNDFRYCDSLTSRPIDLSADSVGDSVYLSFYYQPQGNGYYPLPQDSFILYMRIVYGDWINVWEVPGDTLLPFQQVMIPLNNPLYFFDSFQFRFVNIGALENSNADWNLDYVYLNSGRNMFDTGVNDVAYTTDPSFMLNDYDYMPYRQFLANVGGEMTPTISDSIKNSTSVGYSQIYFFNAQYGASSLLSDPPYTSNLPSYGSTQVVDTLTGYYLPPMGGIYDKVVFDNTFSMLYAGVGSMGNDTIVKQQVFDNYLAYDDGTCEQAYVLNMDPTEPGLIATEYHLNIPDTMQGIAIYFARQVPFPFGYSFDLFVYSQLHGINGGTEDDTLFEEDAIAPGWVDTLNHFYVYPLYRPVPLPSGVFYIVTRQEAGTDQEPIYFGLDVNRVGETHRWYNTTENTWVPSAFNGALMERPLLGKQVISSGIKNVEKIYSNITVSPNPAHDVLNVQFTGDAAAMYQVTAVSGKNMQSGFIFNGQSINIADLPPGDYFLNLNANGTNWLPRKFLKL